MGQSLVQMTIFLGDPTSRWHGLECLLWVASATGPICSWSGSFSKAYFVRSHMRPKSLLARASSQGTARVPPDVPYRGDCWQRMDICLPPQDGLRDLPLLLFMHGGGWSKRNGWGSWLAT